MNFAYHISHDTINQFQRHLNTLEKRNFWVKGHCFHVNIIIFQDLIVTNNFIWFATAEVEKCYDYQSPLIKQMALHKYYLH